HPKNTQKRLFRQSEAWNTPVFQAFCPGIRPFLANDPAIWKGISGFPLILPRRCATMKHTGIYDGRRFSRGGLPLGKTLAMSIFDAFAKLEAERKTVSPPGWLLVGLGNPDRKYENTRHNTGFICLDRAAKDLGTEILRKKFDALTAEGVIAGQRVLLMKPM